MIVSSMHTFKGLDGHHFTVWLVESLRQARLVNNPKFSCRYEYINTHTKLLKRYYINILLCTTRIDVRSRESFHYPTQHTLSHRLIQFQIAGGYDQAPRYVGHVGDVHAHHHERVGP